ncbi:retrotransposon protein, putative, ty1-copia subclass [Tanacetum coccineum]
MGKTVGELHAMLNEYKKGLPKKAETPQVMMIKGGKIQKSNKKSLKAKGKGKANGKGKDKQVYITKPKNPKPSAKEHPAKDDTCHHCKEVGYCKRNYPAYLAELIKKKKQVGTPVFQITKRAKHNLDSTYLWHRRLAHINDKEIVSHRPERANDLLGTIHTDVRGPLRHVSRQGASYFITFTDDYCRYGYVYLLTHKHEDYALESATRILNMVPTKKVDKTPYELWYGKVPNLSYLKVWGCEALVKQDTPDKLQQRSVKCIFIGYPKETMGYYFYFPPENKIVVARYAEFFEKNLITQEVSGRAIDLEEIQDEDTSPSEITSEIPMEVEGFEPPQEEEIPIRRSERSRRGIYKWIDAMNAEIQSVMDNMVWVMVDLPPDCKIVRSKWDFKKKTDMDGIVHTYKARLVAKGYTQLYGVDYEETFSPVADIRAIRILISIAAFYDYEIWQMDVKTAFLNGYLDEDIYMVQLEGFIDPNHPRKVCKLQRSIMVLSKHQEAGIKDLMRKSKSLVLLNILMSHVYIKKLDYLGRCFAMKDLGEATFILGIKIYRDRSKRLIGLGQNAYIDKILNRYKMDNSKRGHIPMQERLDLNKTQGASTPGENPGESHWTTVKNIFKYLRNTKDMFLVYGGNPEAELRVDYYCNAGFETDIDDMKSLTGYVSF